VIDTTRGRSLRTVVVALAANLLIAAAKGGAALVTGSGALLAETGHSVADAGNELFLLVALYRSGRPADSMHPFGYGAERFYWSLLAAIGIFVAGGLTGIWEGIRLIQHPRGLTTVGVGYAVLATSLLLDASSWRTAYRQLRGEARVRHLTLPFYLRYSTDPTATTVVFEDAAGAIGVVLAGLGVALHQLTGSAVPDAVASIAIGLLLIVLALRLAQRERELLTNQSAPGPVVDRVRRLLRDDPRVRGLPRFEVLIIGPRTWLVTAEVAIDNAASGKQVTRLIRELRQRVRTEPGVAEVYLTPVPDPGHP
jgi:cation diffusion facilitator family transporter